MSANYTPNLGEYTELKPFRYWCQKVMPLVYDDSLSYYELLCKVVDYLNKTMHDVDTLHTDVVQLHAAYVQLQQYVNTYFENLDLQSEIDRKLDEMAESGALLNIIKPSVIEEVNRWLTEHITNPSNPPIDKSLTIENAAADSKVTGDKINNLTDDIVTNAKRNLVNLGVNTVVNGNYYLDRKLYESGYYTWYFDVSAYDTNRYIVTAASPAYTNFVTFLDENKNNIGYVANSTNKEATKSKMYVFAPENTKYLAVTTTGDKPNRYSLLVSACISIEEVQGLPICTSDNGEDIALSPIIVKGTTNNGKIDSSFTPGTKNRAALYCNKANCDIKIKCVGNFQIYDDAKGKWMKETLIHENNTGWWFTVKNDTNTDFENIPTGDIVMIALSEKSHDAIAENYCTDITNKFTFNQATDNTIPFTPSDIRVVTSLYNPPQKETIMISVPDTLNVSVKETVLENGVYTDKNMYPDFAENIGMWRSGKIYCNLYPERYYSFLIRNKDNSPISVQQAYKNIHIYLVDNRYHIPEYYRDHIAQKEKEVLTNIASFDSFPFAFITDVHIQRNTKHSPALMRRIINSCAVKTVIGGGDWQTAWNSDARGKNAIIDDMTEMRELYFDVPMLKTIGNHEWAYGANNQYNIKNGEAYNLFYRADDEKAKTEIMYPENGNGTYFYSDDKTNKIRYISINCMDYGDNLDIKKYNKVWYFSISNEQITWLKKSLNLPSDDWMCVVFSHVPMWSESEKPFDSGTLVVNAAEIGNIISGYTAKTGEFSSHKGKILCWVSGHAHRDALIEWHGTHMVVTNADCFVKSEGAQTRTLGTTSEQCFDIFCVDKKAKKVKIVRIGAGENREFSFS